MLKMFKKDNDQPDKMEVTITNKTVLRVLALVLISLLFAAAVKQAAHSLLLVFTAFFLALALNGPVHYLARHLPGRMRGKRSVATAISFLLVVLFVAGFLASIVPSLVHQTQGFIDTVPSLVQDTRNQDSDIGKFIRKYKLENQVDSISDDIGGRLRGLSGSAFKTIGKVGTSIFALLAVLAMTFMMLVEGPQLVKFFQELIPEPRRPDAIRLSRDMYRVITGFVNGQVTLAALASLLIVPALFILHVSYPIALMVIIFICGLIPMVGHTIGAIIVTAVALFTSPLNAVIILGYYILYQQIENYLIQPRIQANSTNMSPLLVFISVIVGVNFGGLFGGLFAIPVAGCIRIIVLDYLIHHSFIARESDAEAPVVKKTAKEAEA